MDDAVNRKMENLHFLLGQNHGEWAFEPKYTIYITPHYISTMLGSLILRHYGAPRSFWDMFAGIGTDSINIYRSFLKEGHTETKFLCTEIDSATAFKLEHNCHKFFLDPHFTCKNTDCIMELATSVVTGDIDPETLLYFDPPWGENYTSDNEFSFSDVKLNNDVKITDFVLQAAARFPIIVKSPRNCSTFDKLFKGRIKHIILFPKLKFLFINGPQA